MLKQLLVGVDVDTNGLESISDGSSKVLAVWATSFGGGTVSLQGSPDGGTTWIDLYMINNVLATFTSDTVLQTQKLGMGMSIRATLTGSSGASNVNAVLFD